MFILELTIRSWCYSERSKRRTLQREDIQAAIANADILDFLVNVPPTHPTHPPTCLFVYLFFTCLTTYPSIQ